MAGQITVLAPCERVEFDELVLAELTREVGATAAETILCRALEDIAIRLTQARALYAGGDHAALRKEIRGVVPVCEQIGLASLANNALAVTACLDGADAVALAATLCRLLRNGETALTAALRQRDLSL